MLLRYRERRQGRRSMQESSFCSPGFREGLGWGSQESSIKVSAEVTARVSARISVRNAWIHLLNTLLGASILRESQSWPMIRVPSCRSLIFRFNGSQSRSSSGLPGTRSRLRTQCSLPGRTPQSAMITACPSRNVSPYRSIIRMTSTVAL